jgi:hypothetical protein
MLDLVRKFKIQVFDHGIRTSVDKGYTVDALADETAIKGLEMKSGLIQFCVNVSASS